MSMTQEEIDALISGGVDNIDEVAEELPQQQSLQDTIREESESNIGIVSQIDPKLELLYDLTLPVSIELGRTNMLIREILRLGRGSVIEFDKLVSEPVDILINGKKVAEGEVVVIDKHFGIRITTLVDPTERLRGLRK